MAINRVKIKDFLVFKDEFVVDFCPGVNIIIGGNATGKTTLLKAMYAGYRGCFASKGLNEIIEDCFGTSIQFEPDSIKIIHDNDVINSKFNPHGNVYIPEKDILEHAKGLLTFIEQKQTGFGKVYRDVIIAAQDVPTSKQSEIQKTIEQKIAGIIGGKIHWDKGDGSFYTLKIDGTRIPFANEASGYKKLGFLGLLVTSGQLEKNSVLFWDEPENSLNPELMPVLVDILLELQREGVQIFIATHSEIFVSYFDANRKDSDKVTFYSLYKNGENVKADKSERFDLLTPNNLTAEQIKLYRAELERSFKNDK
ncbi:MAG: AAA family ATPase [Planctomycetaceae bacterium]|jgi:hypothetical protein|nr:AAA family ATPase [Planctomycetaceae bacterium]